jgi:glycosyltransferase involved in cell wall biosynthesis
MSKRIRVLECIRQGQIGGGESHLLSLVENLDKIQFEPVVLSFTDGPMIERLKQMNVPVHVIQTTKPFDVKKWKTVKKFIKEQNVDLIHAHGTRANSNVLWAAKSLGIPVIYTVHGWSFHPDQKPLIRRVRIMGEKYLTSRTDLNISVSSSNQQSGKSYIPSFNSIVINNGIDLQKFNPNKLYKNIRAELNISNDVILILFIARFTLHKQPLSLIKAFAQALPQNSKMHLLMVGDGDQKKEAIDLIHELKINDQVTLESFRIDVPDVLSAADIFVLPSLWEGLPIGLLEAMAMGKAIIASNVDGTSEIIRDGENGLLVETDNLIPNLTKALVELSRDKNKRSHLEQNAITTVNERFNASNMTRQIEDIYKATLLSRKKISI